MIAGSSSHRKRPLRWLACCAVMVSFAGLRAAGQQTDKLQEQLQELKQQYDTTTRDLQQRIAALEQQIKDDKEVQQKTKENIVSAAELAGEKATRSVLGQSAQVAAKFQGQLASEPTYDLLRDADHKIQKLQEQVGAGEVDGDCRWGCGVEGAGGQQVAFEAPGAEAKYRL